MIGVSGAAAHNPCSPPRTWSTSASVLPLTSARIRSGAVARRYVRAVVACRGNVDVVPVGGEVVLQKRAGGVVLVGDEELRRDVAGGAVHERPPGAGVRARLPGSWWHGLRSPRGLPPWAGPGARRRDPLRREALDGLLRPLTRVRTYVR